MSECANEFPDGRCPNGNACLYRHQVERMAAEDPAGVFASHGHRIRVCDVRVRINLPRTVTKS